jgi:hypothetical protein
MSITMAVRSNDTDSGLEAGLRWVRVAEQSPRPERIRLLRGTVDLPDDMEAVAPRRRGRRSSIDIELV